MITDTINDISQSIDRYKIYVLFCSPPELTDKISYLHTHKIKAINIGKELSIFIDGLKDHSYLNMDVLDFLGSLLESGKGKINGSETEAVAIYNLGILLEPGLELHAAQIIKEFSKSIALIIIWENQSDYKNLLKWPTNEDKYSLYFNDTQIKILQYAL